MLSWKKPFRAILLVGGVFLFAACGGDEDALSTLEAEPDPCDGVALTTIAVDAQPVSGCLNPGKVNVYQFEATAGVEYSAQVIQVGAADGLFSSVALDAEGTQLVSAHKTVYVDPNLQLLSHHLFQATVTGAHFFRVTFEAELGPGNYVIGVFSNQAGGTTAGALPPGAQAAPDVLAVGSNYTGEMPGMLGSYLYYTLDLPQAGWYTLKLVFSSNLAFWGTTATAGSASMELNCGFGTAEGLMRACTFEALAPQPLYVVMGSYLSYDPVPVTLSILGP